MSSKKTLMAALAALFLGAGCDSSERQSSPWPPYLQLLRTDAAHNRLWVFERDALSVHDNTNGRRLRRLVLPDWIMLRAEYGCAPDLVVDAQGVAYASSNVQPVIWRIDPASYEVTRIELTLESDADKDVGFSGLEMSGEGALLASGATFGSLWRIDLVAARAVKLADYAASEPTMCNSATLMRNARLAP